MTNPQRIDLARAWRRIDEAECLLRRAREHLQPHLDARPELRSEVAELDGLLTQLVRVAQRIDGLMNAKPATV